ncbi:MAG: response regulator [Usitatibacter sp.]
MRPALRIAIIDDDESVRKSLRRLLVASGLEAVEFASGRAFLEALASGAFDCALIDFNMPEMRGIDVLKEMAARGIDLPAIIITSYDEPHLQSQCLASGAHAYLHKPLDGKRLLLVIADATATRSRGGD